jgi:hypothetical protein
MLFRGMIGRLRRSLARVVGARNAKQGDSGVPERAFRQPVPESDPVASEGGVKLVELALALTMAIAFGLIVAGVAVLIGT